MNNDMNMKRKKSLKRTNLYKEVTANINYDKFLSKMYNIDAFLLVCGMGIVGFDIYKFYTEVPEIFFGTPYIIAFFAAGLFGTHALRQSAIKHLKMAKEQIKIRETIFEDFEKAHNDYLNFQEKQLKLKKHN